MTLLRIDDEHWVVSDGAQEQRLELGPARIVRDFFHHDPPTPHEIERAIDFTEDQIMRMGPRREEGAALRSLSSSLQPWAAVSGPTLTIERVEQWFDRLAAAAQGQVSALEGLPRGREAAATLLVLREFMHHRGHGHLLVLDPGPQSLAHPRTISDGGPKPSG